MKRTLSIMFGVAAVMSVLSVGAVSLASPLTFTFQGQVSSIISDDSSGTFGANFAVGDSVSGSWTFDTTATQHPLLSYASYYDATFNAMISGKAFSGAAQYRIFDNSPGGDDGFSVINETGTYTAPALGPLTPRTFFVQFLGMPTTTLSDQSLVTNPAGLFSLYNPSYAPHWLRLDNPDGTFGGLYFTISSVTPVPEPSTGLLLLAGLGGIVWAVRRKASETVRA